MNIRKSEIELFEISQKLSKFLSQHRVLSYLFANTMFKFGSIYSLFMINDSQKSWTIRFISFSLKKIQEIKHFLTK
jgi:hypothetical protein